MDQKNAKKAARVVVGALVLRWGKRGRVFDVSKPQAKKGWLHDSSLMLVSCGGLWVESEVGGVGMLDV